MSRRDRIEDLGRIAEILNLACDDELFEWKGNVRNKEAAEWFMNLNNEKQCETIHSLAYKIDYLHNKLHEMYQIARYGDDEQSE